MSAEKIEAPCNICGFPLAACECVKTRPHEAGVFPRVVRVEGVGPDAQLTVNAKGGKQSDSPYRSDLLPPQALLAVARVLKRGADKYGDDNWRKIERQDHINHALTHILSFQAGDT